MPDNKRKVSPKKTHSGGTKETPIKKRKPQNKTEANTIKNKGLFLELFLKTGNITAACKNGNIGRQTFYNWMKNDVVFKRDFEDCEDALLDFAEGKLMNLIDEKNPTAIIFFLKTKGKERGYIEPTYMNIQANMKHSHSHRISLRELKQSHDRITGKNKK